MLAQDSGKIAMFIREKTSMMFTRKEMVVAVGFRQPPFDGHYSIDKEMLFTFPTDITDEQRKRLDDFCRELEAHHDGPYEFVRTKFCTYQGDVRVNIQTGHSVICGGSHVYCLAYVSSKLEQFLLTIIVQGQITSLFRHGSFEDEVAEAIRSALNATY